MDVVHGLLRSVVRGFYDIRAIIVMDAMLMHHVLSDRELSQATGVSAKDLRSTCARLKDDHLIKEVAHKEGPQPGTRQYTQNFYYIHFTEAVDAIKWKMHIIENKLKEELDHQHSAQDYVCERCGTHYETINALALFDDASQQFLCELCGGSLKEDEVAVEAANEGTGQRQMEELMEQLQPLINALQRIDELSIPENTFESEQQRQVPLLPDQAPASDQLKAQRNAGVAGSDNGLGGLTVAGSADSRLPQNVQSTFQINITSEAEQQSQAAELAREKRRLAEENALPDWHARSTVDTAIHGGEVKREAREDTLTGASEPPVKGPRDAQSEDAMEAYYRKLQEQQVANAEDDDDEEEDDEFEDIV